MFTLDRWWTRVGESVFGFSVSCLLLFIFSAPSDTRMDRPLAAYAFAYFLVFCGGWGLGAYKRGKEHEIVTAVLGTVGAWIIFYFVLQACKKVARTLTPAQLQDFVVGSVLVYGSMKLSSLLYLTAQGLKCVGGGGVNCQATTFPVFSISAMILLILLFRLAILPSTTTSPSGSQIGAFKDLKLRTKVSMLGLLLAGVGNTFLFANMSESGISDELRALYVTVLITIGIVAVFELVALIRFERERRRQTIAVESGAAPPPPPSTPKSRITEDSHNMFDNLTGGFT